MKLQVLLFTILLTSSGIIHTDATHNFESDSSDEPEINLELEKELREPVEIVNQPLEFIKGTLSACASITALYIGSQNLMFGIEALLTRSNDRQLATALRLITAMALFDMASTKGLFSLSCFKKVFG